MTLPETASQTAGPFVHIGLMPDALGPAPLGTDPYPGKDGPRLRLSGRVRDGLGAPLRDVVLEFWQADREGRFGPGTRGWARRAADGETGLWRLDTIRPGPVPAPGGGMQAPHIAVFLIARGINLGLHTRIYLPEGDLAADPLLSRIEHQSRRETLVARPAEDGYTHDIRLQGERETLFLDM